MVALAAQAIVINIVFVLMGSRLLSVEPWTARTFILSVFGEIAGMVLIVVKYLFTPSSEQILRFLGTRTRKKPRGKKKNGTPRGEH